MSGSWVTLMILFMAGLLLNLPIAFALGAASIIFLLFFTSLPIDMFIQACFSGIDSMPLLAVPFFILAGEIMLVGGISKRLIDVAKSCINKIPGALGVVTAVSSAFFAAISGSGPATVACIGGITIPEMKKDKYDPSFASAIAAVSGTLGPVIPPSIVFIVYGVSVNVSITKLFIAGVIPGFLMVLALCIWVYIVSRKHNYGLSAEAHASIMPVSKALMNGIWAMLVPVIILGGIYGGFFTPTEAAIVSCVYGILVGALIYRELTVRAFVEALRKAALTTGTVLILVATATAFGRLVAMSGLTELISTGMPSLTDNVVVLLLLINVFLFIVGMFMETLAATIILAPILLQVVAPYNVNPIHFGVIMCVNLVIGMCTPPVGVNLFVATRIGKVSIEQMVRPLLPAIGALLIVLMLVTYIPGLSLFLIPK